MIKQHANDKLSAGNKKIFWKVFLLNAACVIFYQLVCDVRFASQNDQFLCHIFAGSHTDHGTGYGYVNLVTGYIIKKLYLAIPHVPWYALLQYVCIFICFMVITLIVLQDKRNWGRYIVCFVFLFLLGYECYARISYTKTGSVSAAAAYFLLYQIADGKLHRRRYLAAVFIFFVTGYLWWDFSVVLAGLIMAVPCGYRLYKSMRGENKKRGRFILLVIASAAAVSIFMECFHDFYIRRYPQIQEYVSYMQNYQYIDNFGWPDYYVCQSEYESLGISKNTYDMLVKNEVVLGYQVPLETLLKIRQLSDSSRHGFQKILAFTRNYPIRFFDTPLFYGVLIFLFLFYLSASKEKSRRTVYICIAVMAAYMACFLHGNDQFSQVRVCIWLTVMILIIQFLEDIYIENAELRKYDSFAVAIVMLMMIQRSYADLSQTVSSSQKANLQQLTEWVHADEDHFYVTNHMGYYKKDGPFDRLQAGEFKNFLMTQNEYMMYNNTFLGDVLLGDLEKVRFTSDDYAQRAAAYLNENYGGYFYVSHIADMGLTQIYMMRNGDISLNTEQIHEADSADIVSDVNMYAYDNFMIKGSIYKKGTNSFEQKVYVELYDHDTDEYAYYDVIQEKAPGRTDVFDGKYSAVFAEIEQEENKDYAVILAIDGQMYRVPLQAIDGHGAD